jgi:hypothetical protein
MAETVPPALRTNEPEPPPVPPAPRPVGSGYVICDFCRCKLAADGKVLEMSEPAEQYRDGKAEHKKAVAVLDEQIAGLKKQIEAKDAEIVALKGTPATKRGITIG